MNGLTTAAWVSHDLALAAGLGGPLFAKTGLDRAVKTIHSHEERGEVVKASWRLHRWVNLTALAVTAGTWFAGRLALSGRQVSGLGRTLVIAKDILIGTAVVAGFVSWILGNQVTRKKGPAALEGGVPAPETDPRQAMLLRGLNVLGYVNMACYASLIGVTTMLASEAGESLTWKATTKLLP